MLRKTLLSICSLALAGCMNGAPLRPDAPVYQMLVSPDEKTIEAFGYNVRNDYDESGTLKPGAEPIEVMIHRWGDIRGWYCTDEQGFKKSKAYGRSLTKWIKNHCK